MIQPEPWWREGYRISWEPVTRQSIEEFKALLEEHALETIGRRLNAEIDYYLERAARGHFAAIDVRDTELRPVGYLGFRIETSPYEGHTVVAEELFYLSPAVRGTTLALETIKYFVQCARWLGARELYMGYTRKRLNGLYRQAGLREISVLYGMELEPDEDSQDAGLRGCSPGTGPG